MVNRWLFVVGILFVSTVAVLHGRNPSATADGPAKSSLAETRPLPEGELGHVIRLGRELVNRTNEHPLSRSYVGNALTCSSCHLDAGTDLRAASFIDVATAYPAWSPREQRVITLEDRVQICFTRSMNGSRPPSGGKVSVAITAYITWLSTGRPIRMNPSRPLGPNHVRPLRLSADTANTVVGQEIYTERCADCHGPAGQGGDDGPPVWGASSYNDGAGLARNDKLAAWLHVAMPLGEPDLTEQQAVDLAAYINSHPRPKFVPQPRRGPSGRQNADPDTTDKSEPSP